MNTNTFMVIQGRRLTPQDIEQIQTLILENPSWHRKRLSLELCARWNWHSENGQRKDMACRSMLLKLHRAGRIELPAPRSGKNNTPHSKKSVELPLDTTRMEVPLEALKPLALRQVQTHCDLILFRFLLSRYHYLGYSGAVGKNLKYLVFDRAERPVSALLFGSAAWKTAPRDQFIGWDAATRERNLQRMTNNMRFLILPWVRVPHLASHILGHVCRRIRADWLQKYNHPLALLETFVDRSRFAGTCYQAANWIRLGQTTGRTRNDRFHNITATIKDVYVYPLSGNFRQELCCVNA